MTRLHDRTNATLAAAGHKTHRAMSIDPACDCAWLPGRMLTSFLDGCFTAPLVRMPQDNPTHAPINPAATNRCYRTKVSTDPMTMA